MPKEFYCQQLCCSPDFDINKWNSSYLEIESMPISQNLKNKLIDGKHCKAQCFDCMAIVGKTRELRSSNKNKKNDNSRYS